MYYLQTMQMKICKKVEKAVIYWYYAWKKLR